MAQLRKLKRQLKPGKVYRRDELTAWSNSVDRHLEELVEEKVLQKVSHGMYYVPRPTVFGAAPPDEKVLVKSFLKDDRFLLTSPNNYNSLGVGTTQLYNTRVVYNHKRHGEQKLGNRTFFFRMKPFFPKKLTEEFLFVDLVNNLASLAEDQDAVLNNVKHKVAAMNEESKKKLGHAVKEFGYEKTKKFFSTLVK